MAGGENVEPGGKGLGGTADKRQKGAKDGKEGADESDLDQVSGSGTSQDGPAESSGSAKDAVDVPLPPWLEPHSEGLQYSTELNLTPFYASEGPEGADDRELDPRAWPGGDVGSALRPGGHESGTRTYGEADALGDVGSKGGSGHKLRPGDSDGSPHGTETPSDWDLWVERNTAWLDAVQTTLDVIGLVPVVGEWADALSGVVSLVRGDFVGAALSFGAMVPVVGAAFTGGKKARKVAGASDEVAAAGKYGDEAAGGGKQADEFASRRQAAGIPDDDPLIDTNILGWLAAGRPDAVRFAERYRGLVSIDHMVAREFIRGGRSAKSLHALMKQYSIRLLPRVPNLHARASSIGKALGRSSVRTDDYIVATAKYYGIRFASGDKRAIVTAIKSGVDARYFHFGTGSVIKRYRKMLNVLRGNALTPARQYIGPLNPW